MGGGGSVGGGWVGSTDVLVGRECVVVGRKGVVVGRNVGPEVGRAVVSRGSRVREVAVARKVEVGVGVWVGEGVAVGIVDVTVGVSLGVRVGAVDVGKGPRSASEVSARAVLVLLALRKISIPWPELPNANQSQTKKPRIRMMKPTARRLSRFSVMFNSVGFLCKRSYG